MSERFSTLADSIVYRWRAERDTWVGPGEIAEVRAFLAQAGIRTHLRADGRFDVDAGTREVCDAARLVLLALRELHDNRRRDAARPR